METIKIKSFILDETNWLEVTWVKEIVTQVEDEEKVEETILHCESYSGHKEHIAMLKAKALEFNTDLEEYESLIKQAEDAYVYPTEEEINKYKIEQKVQEAKNYLASTDYKMTIDYFATLSKDEQDSLILLRAEAREFVRTHQGVK